MIDKDLVEQAKAELRHLRKIDPKLIDVNTRLLSAKVGREALNRIERVGDQRMNISLPVALERNVTYKGFGEDNTDEHYSERLFRYGMSLVGTRKTKLPSKRSGAFFHTFA